MVLLSTVPDEETGKRIAFELLESKLVACVSLIPGATSFYWWEGAIKEGRECFLLLKTTKQKIKALCERYPTLHPYQVPELIGFKGKSPFEAYSQWVHSVTESCDNGERDDEE